jgi:hypothetical protein
MHWLENAAKTHNYSFRGMLIQPQRRKENKPWTRQSRKLWAWIAAGVYPALDAARE